MEALLVFEGHAVEACALLLRPRVVFVGLLFDGYTNREGGLTRLRVVDGGFAVARGDGVDRRLLLLLLLLPGQTLVLADQLRGYWGDVLHR